jgi:hypothetical protein
LSKQQYFNHIVLKIYQITKITKYTSNVVYYKLPTQHLEPRRRRGNGVRARRPPTGASSSGGGLRMKRCGREGVEVKTKQIWMNSSETIFVTLFFGFGIGADSVRI